jgi:hypothetical protein
MSAYVPLELTMATLQLQAHPDILLTNDNINHVLCF